MPSRVLAPLAWLGLAACAADAPAPPPPPEVTIAEVRTDELADWDEYQGEFQAVDAVEVRPRVSGYLIKVGFTEGKEVRKGDVLFEIDPQPYAATLDERRADLTRARARLELSQRDAERGKTLVEKQAISQEEQDTRLTVASEGRAEVLAAEAAMRAAELDLGYTKVRAPVSGRAGRAEVTAGNLVNSGPTGSTLLTTVVSLDPIYVYFEGDESAYLRYAHLARSGERRSSRDVPNPVQIGLSDEHGFPHAGHMDFVDNRLDPATGTIRARAVVANKEGLFTPGMFARVRLIGSGLRRVTLIPEAAVSTDQDRKFVFVLQPDSTVAYRAVTLGRQVDGERRIVQDGLKPGERIVVNGFARIRPGVKVKAVTAPPDSGAGAAAKPASTP
jgi:RND family efflux transporter MFP subunit